MRESTTTLTPAQVYRFASDFCQPHLGNIRSSTEMGVSPCCGTAPILPPQKR